MESLGLSWQTYKGKITNVMQVTGTLFASMETLAEKRHMEQKFEALLFLCLIILMKISITQ